VGLGEPVPRAISRLMLQLKAHALGLGYSGVSNETFERLLLFAREDLVPVVPSRGSVGASGDLAPLAHMSLPLVGLGSFWDEDGKSSTQAADIWRRRGLASIELQPKDGLSLINGTQLMAAYCACVLHRAKRLAVLADVVSAMSLEALQGSIKPFD